MELELRFHLTLAEHSLIIDSLGAASAAYSLRKLRSAYSGACLRLRRSSDSTEQDIGFVDWALDAQSVASFLSGSQGYVVTLFDQAASYNLTQATTSLQPELIYDLQKSTYLLSFSGGKFLRNSSFVGSLASSTISLIWKASSLDAALSGPQGGIDFASNEFFSPWWTVTQTPFLSIGGTNLSSDAIWEDGSWRQHTLKFASGKYDLYQHGAQSIDQATVSAPAYSRLTIGKNDNADGSFSFFEFILWNSSKSELSLAQDFKDNFKNLMPLVPRLYYVFGDSNSTTGFCGLGDSWTRGAFFENTSYGWYGLTRGGFKITDAIAALSRANTLAENIPHASKHAIIWLGTNDIALDAITGTEAASRINSLAVALRDAGWNSITVATLIPRFTSASGSGIAFESNRQAFRTAVLADSEIDYVIDVHSASIGINGAQDGTTYFVGDNVHLNTLGQSTLATLAESTILQIEGGHFMSITSNTSVTGIGSGGGGGGGGDTSVTKTILTVEASDSNTGTTTNVAGLSPSLAANKTYKIIWYCTFFNSSALPAVRVYPSYPSGYAAVAFGSNPANPGSLPTTLTPSNDTLAGQMLGANTGDYYVAQYVAVIKMGATAGTLTFGFRSVVAGTTLIKADVSYVEVTQLD